MVAESDGEMASTTASSADVRGGMIRIPSSIAFQLIQSLLDFWLRQIFFGDRNCIGRHRVYLSG
jgi:hypothetical protein